MGDDYWCVRGCSCWLVHSVARVVGGVWVFAVTCSVIRWLWRYSKVVAKWLMCP